jgi:predicted nuclease of restriction endonuclease-like (RecB) superfamily
MNFKMLAQQIESIHEALQTNAVNAVNRHITFRNWIIGLYVLKYQQKGEDRAKYGNKLLEKLAIKFSKTSLKGLTAPELSRCRQFYITYPSILGTLSQESVIPQLDPSILGTVSQEFESMSVKVLEKFEGINTGLFTKHYNQLFSTTSYSHFSELIKISDIYKRTYYELLVCKTTLSVRELRDSINTLSYERTGLSKNKNLSLQTIASKIKPTKPADAIKDFYFFNFLELANVDVVDETQLETALLNHLEKFILELGNGFCFEARQKRILIGDEYFFIDMVFYHRILKCHVLVELKVDKFNAEHATQLKNYIKYYNKEVKVRGDNPTVGILLVTDKNKALVEFTMDGINEKMFVSKYAVELPTKRQLENFIKRELKKL